MITKLYTLLSCIFFTYALQAQTVTPQVMNAGGGSVTNAYYQYEWSVGETASIETLSSPFLTVTTGLLQQGTNAPAEVNTANLWGSDEIKIFPNPVETKLEINFLSKQSGKVSMLLMDDAGKVVSKKELQYNGNGHIEQWDMSAVAKGGYFISITLKPNAGSVAKKGGFKIQKIK